MRPHLLDLGTRFADVNDGISSAHLEMIHMVRT